MEEFEDKNLDKVKRKLDSELKSAQTQIDEIDKAKRDIEEVLKRKESELANSLAKLDEEHAQVNFFSNI